MEDDLDSGDVSGLSELGSSSSSCISSCFSNLSRVDTVVSRLASQLEDVKLFKAWTVDSSQASSPSSPRSTVSSPSLLSQHLKVPRKIAVEKTHAEEDESSAFMGNGKNHERLLPSFVPQLYGKPCVFMFTLQALLEFFARVRPWVHSSNVSEVLKSLRDEAQNLPSDPVPLSAQYVATFVAEGDEAADEDDEEAKPALSTRPEVRRTTFRRKKRPLKANPKKKKGQKKSNAAKAKPKPSVGEPPKVSNSSYSPHYFHERSQIFIQKSRADGNSHKVAVALWTQSQERRELLAGLTVQELKRRKFVPKTCVSNPFAASLGGA